MSKKHDAIQNKSLYHKMNKWLLQPRCQKVYLLRLNSKMIIMIFLFTEWSCSVFVLPHPWKFLDVNPFYKHILLFNHINFSFHKISKQTIYNKTNNIYSMFNAFRDFLKHKTNIRPDILEQESRNANWPSRICFMINF